LPHDARELRVRGTGISQGKSVRFGLSEGQPVG
jgi:hypothetical protein